MSHVCLKHPLDIEKVERNIADDRTIAMMSGFLKVLADPTRLKIANALAVTELCVCDVAHLLAMEHSAVSHQMSVLRKANVVVARKCGKAVYYSLSDEHVNEIIKVTIAHLTE